MKNVCCLIREHRFHGGAYRMEMTRSDTTERSPFGDDLRVVIGEQGCWPECPRQRGHPISIRSTIASSNDLNSSWCEGSWTSRSSWLPGEFVCERIGDRGRAGRPGIGHVSSIRLGSRAIGQWGAMASDESVVKMTRPRCVLDPVARPDASIHPFASAPPPFPSPIDPPAVPLSSGRE